METVTELQAREVTFNCPCCGKRQDGFLGDPRGEEYECDDCGKTYKVHNDADIEMH